MKKLIYLILGLFLFLSCQSDNEATVKEEQTSEDNQKEVNVKDLVEAIPQSVVVDYFTGKWKVSNIHTEANVPKSVQEKLAKQSLIFEFREDGTFLLISKKQSTKGSWHVSDNQICVSLKEGVVRCQVPHILGKKSFKFLFEPMPDIEVMISLKKI